MNNCGSCRFFGEAVTMEDIATPYHKCKSMEHDTSNSERKAGKLAMVIDGSGYFACLKVEADFGCVKWEWCGENESK